MSYNDNPVPVTEDIVRRAIANCLETADYHIKTANGLPVGASRTNSLKAAEWCLDRADAYANSLIIRHHIAAVVRAQTAPRQVNQ